MLGAAADARHGAEASSRSDGGHAGGGGWPPAAPGDRGLQRALEEVEGRLMRLERAAGRAQERLLDVEHSVQSLLGGRSAGRLSEDLAEMQRSLQERPEARQRLASLEAAVAESRTAMEAKINDMLSGLLLGTQRIRQVEATVSALEGHPEHLMELTQSMRQMKLDSEGLQQRLSDCEHSAEQAGQQAAAAASAAAAAPRLGAGEAGELRAGLAAAQREVAELREAAARTAPSPYAPAAPGLDDVAARITETERKMSSLVSASLHDVQQSTEGLASLSARLEELSQRMGGLARSEEFDELTTIVSHVHKQANRCEGAMQGLASATEVQELKESMLAVQAKLGVTPGKPVRDEETGSQATPTLHEVRERLNELARVLDQVKVLEDRAETAQVQGLMQKMAANIDKHSSMPDVAMSDVAMPDAGTAAGGAVAAGGASSYSASSGGSAQDVGAEWAGKLAALEETLSAVARQAERVEPAIACIEQLADQLGEVRALASGGGQASGAPGAGAGGFDPAAALGLEKRLARCEQEARSTQDMVQKLEVVQDRTLGHVRKLDRGDSGNDAVVQLRDAVTMLQARLASLEAAGVAAGGGCGTGAMSEALVLADSRASVTQEVRYATTGIHADLQQLRQALEGKMSTRELQKVQSTLEGIDGRVGRVELLIQDKPDASSIQQISGDLSTIQLKFGELDIALQQKADVKEHRRLLEEVAGLRGLTTDDSNNIEGIMRQMRGLENDMQASSSHQQQSKRALLDVDAKINGLSMVLQDKADAVQFKTVSGAMAVVQSQLKACERESSDKASQVQGQLQQLGTNLTSLGGKLSTVETTLHDKVSASQMLQTKRVLAEMEARFDGFEMSLKDKADTCQFMDLNGTVASLRTQISSCEQELHQKVDAGQYKSLHSTIVAMQSSLTGCEHEMHDKASNEQFQQVKSTVAGLRSQIANAELELHGKAGAEQLQLLRVSMSGLEAKVSTCGQQQQQQQHQLRMIQEGTAALRRQSLLALEDGGGSER